MAAKKKVVKKRQTAKAVRRRSSKKAVKKAVKAKVAPQRKAKRTTTKKTARKTARKTAGAGSGRVSKKPARAGRKSAGRPRGAKKTKALTRRASPGRPTLYSDAVAEQICDLIAEGQTWRDIAKRRGMPSERTIGEWLRKYVGFSQQYACARAARAEIMLGEFEDMRRALAAAEDHIQIARIRVSLDALKWLMGKFYRKVYGDTLDVEMAQAPPQDELDYALLSDAELQELERLVRKATPKAVKAVGEA